MFVANVLGRPVRSQWLAWGLLWVLVWTGPHLAWGQAKAPPAPPALANYIARPEPRFEWKVTNRL